MNEKSGMEDIKAQLYAALMKNKYGPPEYRYFCETDGRQYFRCECSVKAFEEQFVAVETAQQKKQAQTKAAMTMGDWMVKMGHLRAEELPQLVEEQKKAKEAKNNQNGEEPLLW